MYTITLMMRFPDLGSPETLKLRKLNPGFCTDGKNAALEFERGDEEGEVLERYIKNQQERRNRRLGS